MYSFLYELQHTHTILYDNIIKIEALIYSIITQCLVLEEHLDQQ